MAYINGNEILFSSSINLLDGGSLDVSDFVTKNDLANAIKDIESRKVHITYDFNTLVQDLFTDSVYFNTGDLIFCISKDCPDFVVIDKGNANINGSTEITSIESAPKSAQVGGIYRCDKATIMAIESGIDASAFATQDEFATTITNLYAHIASTLTSYAKKEELKNKQDTLGFTDVVAGNIDRNLIPNVGAVNDALNTLVADVLPDEYATKEYVNGLAFGTASPAEQYELIESYIVETEEVVHRTYEGKTYKKIIVQMITPDDADLKMPKVKLLGGYRFWEFYSYNNYTYNRSITVGEIIIADGFLNVYCIAGDSGKNPTKYLPLTRRLFEGKYFDGFITEDVCYVGTIIKVYGVEMQNENQ